MGWVLFSVFSVPSFFPRNRSKHFLCDLLFLRYSPCFWGITHTKSSMENVRTLNIYIVLIPYREDSNTMHSAICCIFSEKLFRHLVNMNVFVFRRISFAHKSRFEIFKTKITFMNRFFPQQSSPLYYSSEEPRLNYLKPLLSTYSLSKSVPRFLCPEMQKLNFLPLYLIVNS